MTDLANQEDQETPFDPASIKLTERQVEAITYIEQIHGLSGDIPSADRLASVFSIAPATARKWLSSPEFEYILQGKGVLRTGTDGVLTAPQLMIINMLLNIADRRSDREKCEAAGITPNQLAAWRRDPEFMGYLHKRAERLFKDSEDIAYLNVVKNINSGDLGAAKFYFEMTGKYQPSMRLDVNIDMVLARIIEILQVRVQDPQTLELIAGDFEELMSGISGSNSFVQEQGAIAAYAQEVRPSPLADLPSFGGTPDLDLKLED